MATQALLLVTAAKKTIKSFECTSNKLAAFFSKPFNPLRKLSYDEEEEFVKLKSKLERIRATLRDAEKVAISGHVTALWVTELRDLELRAQDVVEEVELRLERAHKLEEFKSELLRDDKAEEARSKLPMDDKLVNKRKREVSFCQFRPPMSSLRYKMRKIHKHFDDISSDRKALKLRKADGKINLKASLMNPTSNLRRGELYGRKEDLENVIKMLLSNDGNQRMNYSIITILGMPGVGKTSLIQHVCDDSGVKSEFGTPIWVQDSPQFHLEQLARQIEQGIFNRASYSLGIDSIHREINGHVKKFLLVLDDVWIENKEKWDTLMAPLMSGLSGSKVIVTTRNRKVAKMISHEDKVYRLDCLSDDGCWSVCKELIENGGHKLNPDLESIGKSITVKCKGLPLAARAVGGILINPINEDHWNEVLESNLWLDKDAYDKVLPALRISYDYLFVPLKRCFLYCSLFPKDHVFRRDQMVRLWMAQGFIDSSELAPSLEFLALKYFDELVAKCFFQLSPFHDITEGCYKMHDLYHELAQHVSCKECSRTEGYILSCNNDHVRYSSLVPLKTHCNNAMNFGSFKGQDLRTFLFLGNMEYKSDGIPFAMQITDDLFLNLLCLRVLDLSNTNMEELSDSIGYLIHLRYLGLENTRIKFLPETISYLFNLLVMNLSNCHDLVELPKGTKLLSSLRHLDLPIKQNSNILTPRGVGQLTDLQSLRMFVVGTNDYGCRIQELGNLHKLAGELSIIDINHVTDIQSAEGARLLDKAKLQKLTLQWSDADTPKINRASEEILERLKPHPNLKELVIEGFPGTILPSWLGDQHLLKLVILELKDCVNNAELPSLGRLPSLKYLGVSSMPTLTRICREFYGCVGESSTSSSSNNTNSNGFPKLKTLKFHKMDSWAEWGGVSSKDFPCLQYLVLDRCPELRVLPQINNLLHLRVHDCGKLQKDNWAENLANAHRPIPAGSKIIDLTVP